MQNINLILVLLLIIIFICILSYKIKENFFNITDNVFGLKIFVNEIEDSNCNINDKKKWKCGWKIIGTYPEIFPKFEKIHMYNKPNIIVVSKGLKGDKGLIGDPGDPIDENTKFKININKINDYTNKNLNINSDNININSDNKIKLHEYSKICTNSGRNCLDNRIFNNIYDYFYKNETNDENEFNDDLRPVYTHPDDCTIGKICYFKNINTAKMFKAQGQVCEVEPKYNSVICKRL